MIYGGDGQLAIELRLCSVYCDTSMTGTVLSFLTTCRFEVKNRRCLSHYSTHFFIVKLVRMESMDFIQTTADRRG